MKKAFLQLHIAVFLAGFTAILGKLILLNEGLLVWYRLLLTVIILGAVMFFKNELDQISLKDAFKISGVGALIAIHWVCFYGSIKYANVSVGLVCLSASGFFTALFEPLILKTKFILAELLIGIVAIAGIYLIFDFYPQYKVGIIFGVISAMGAATFPICNKQLLNRFSPKLLTLYVLSGGFIILTILLPLYLSQFPADYYFPTFKDWGWLLILAVLCTIVAFNFQLNALKKISAFTANLAYNLEPVYGIILAFIFFHENKLLHSEFFFGLGLIMFAVLLQMIRVLRAARQSAKRNRQ